MFKKNTKLNRAAPYRREKRSHLEERDFVGQQESFFSASKSSHSKGLQQYFTPLPFARMIAAVLWPEVAASVLQYNRYSSGDPRYLRRACVFDPTAGRGNLLVPWLEEDTRNQSQFGPAVQCFGIEIDAQVAAAPDDERIEIVVADFTKVFPYLLDVGFTADVILCNPPYGLHWEVDLLTKPNVESQSATLQMVLRLLEPFGVGAYIVSETANIPEDMRKRTFAVVRVNGMFRPHSDVRVILGFFANKHLLGPVFDAEIDGYASDEAELVERLGQLALRIRATASANRVLLSSVAGRNQEELRSFNAALSEYAAARAAEKRPYSISLENGKVKVALSDYQRFTLHKHHYSLYNILERLNGVGVEYFVLNAPVKKKLISLATSPVAGISVSPKLLGEIERACRRSEAVIAPFQPLAPHMSLGYLDTGDSLLCVQTGTVNDELGRSVTYEKGKYYPVNSVSAEIASSSLTKEENGQTKEYVREGKILRIQIGDHVFREEPRDLEFIAKHFEIPVPKTVKEYFPERYQAAVSYLQQLRFVRNGAVYGLMPFQVEDLALASLKDSLVLRWEQGLGKTIAGLIWAKGLKRAKKTLVVTTKDLKRQWHDEAASLGLRLIEIDGYGDFLEEGYDPAAGRNLLYCGARYAQRAQSGVFIIHYEKLKKTNRYDVSDDFLPPLPQCPKCHSTASACGYCSEQRRLYGPQALCSRHGLLGEDLDAQRAQGPLWDGRVCRVCGYEHRASALPSCPSCGKWFRRRADACGCGWTTRKLAIPGIYKLLKRHVFDAVIVDEGVKIKSRYSLQGLAVRALRARYKLILSGSPVKGWITDVFHLLHWALGNRTARFPYGWDGTSAFLDDFAVYEYAAEEYRRSLHKGRKKIVPELTNLSMLWRLLAPAVVSRLKGETGEPIVAKHVHYVRVPFTTDQRQVYSWWMENFTEWFLRTHPQWQHGSEKAELMRAVLGELWKLRLAATVPGAELLGKLGGQKADHSFTAKHAHLTKIVLDGLRDGRQSVIFTSLKENATFIKELLERGGVRVALANSDVPPDVRAAQIARFKNGEFDVLVAGTQAVNLGHNLYNASIVVVTDYEWDHSTMRQAVDRVHRLISSRDVDVYMLYLAGSIDEYQLDIIKRKGAMSDLALQGRIQREMEEYVDFFQIAKQMIADYKDTKAREMRGDVPADVVRRKTLEALDAFRRERSGEMEFSLELAAATPPGLPKQAQPHTN